jgi:hypothetical protein
MRLHEQVFNDIIFLKKKKKKKKIDIIKLHLDLYIMLLLL